MPADVFKTILSSLYGDLNAVPEISIIEKGVYAEHVQAVDYLVNNPTTSTGAVMEQNDFKQWKNRFQSIASQSSRKSGSIFVAFDDKPNLAVMI